MLPSLLPFAARLRRRTAINPTRLTALPPSFLGVRVPGKEREKRTASALLCKHPQPRFSDFQPRGFIWK